jgi:hypothetical protein
MAVMGLLYLYLYLNYGSVVFGEFRFISWMFPVRIPTVTMTILKSFEH